MRASRHKEGECVTVGRLARHVGLSRATLLYYDRIRILMPTGRSGSNYRVYTPADRERLEQICLYRRMGIPLKDIARLLEASGVAGLSGQILQRRLAGLETQIAALHQQEQQILRLLEQLSKGADRKPQRSKGNRRPALAQGQSAGAGNSEKEKTMISKQKWVEIMRAAGFGEEEMRNWHRTFERMEPQGHQEFLESLGIGADEIARIRASSAQ